MQTTQDITTLLCLFHTHEHATEALNDLESAGLPPGSVTVLGPGSNSSSTAEQLTSTLRKLELPASDVDLLSRGVNNGGTVIVVSAAAQYAAKVESIFDKHQATQVDETVISDEAPVAVPAAARSAAARVDEGAVIPVVEETLVVGKRQVERGGVRVYSRIVETPVEEKITLREEHASVKHVPVNRPVTAADMEALRVQSVEVTETAEEAVVSKSARVVEEVRVGKETTERTQQVTDKLRKTQVEVETLAAESTDAGISRTAKGGK